LAVNKYTEFSRLQPHSLFKKFDLVSLECKSSIVLNFRQYQIDIATYMLSSGFLASCSEAVIQCWDFTFYLCSVNLQHLINNWR